MAFPCKDCITLPLCQSQLRFNHKSDESYKEIYSKAYEDAFKLYAKCSILRSYLNKQKPKVGNLIYTPMMDMIIKFFSDKGVICFPVKTV